MSKGLEQCDKCDYFISVEDAYKQGREEGRADAIDKCKYKIVDSLEKELGCKLCSSYEEKIHCSKCRMREIINFIVDILEQSKEEDKND